MIWIIYYLFLVVITLFFVCFVAKNKVNKNKILFLIYYFILFIIVSSLNDFLALDAKKITNSNTFLVLINVLFPLVIIIFAVPATFFTARLKKRKLYIWWFHCFLIITGIIGLFATNEWVLLITSISLGMATSALGVHQLMFNEQNFNINKGFLSYTLLLVPTLLANLIVYPIFYNDNLSVNNYWIYYLFFFLAAIVTLVLSFFLKEDKNEIGKYEDFILKKIKTYEWKHFLVLLALAFLFFLLYFISSNDFLNYTIKPVLNNSKLKPYLFLINLGSQIIGAFFLGYFLFSHFRIKVTLVTALFIWIISLFGFLCATNVYLLTVALILLNIAYGILIFIIYSLILEWNFRQTAPLTGIYSAIVTVLVLINNLLTILSSLNIITIGINEQETIFYTLSIISLVSLVISTIFIIKTVGYWNIEEELILELEEKPKA